MRVIFLLGLFLLSACGKQGTPATIDVVAGFAIGSTEFEGGFVVVGRKNDNSMEFTRTFVNGTGTIQLPNGKWHFYAVGWKGNNNGTIEPADVMSGAHYCGYSSAELTGTATDVDIFLQRSHCSSYEPSGFDGSPFTVALDAFMSVDGNGYNQFEALKLKNCLETTIGNCTSAGNAQSVKVIIPRYTKLGGGAQIEDGLTSACINGGSTLPIPVSGVTTTLQIPISTVFPGGALPLVVAMYPNATCSGTAEKTTLSKGFMLPNATINRPIVLEDNTTSPTFWLKRDP